MDLQLITSWLSAGSTGLSALFTAIAAAAAWKAASLSNKALENTRVSREDDELLVHASKCLERAYEALMRNSDGSGKPSSDRFSWLLCARLLEEYKETKLKIASQTILTRCSGEEEFWRYRIHDRLKEIGILKDHFLAVPEGPVEPVSAIIVHDFAEWPKGKSDPIDNYTDAKDAALRLGVSPRWIALNFYLEKFIPPGTGH